MKYIQNKNDNNENQIERSLETINRNYDSLAIRTKVRLQNTNNTQPSIKSTTTTAEEQEVKEKDRIEKEDDYLFI